MTWVAMWCGSPGDVTSPVRAPTCPATSRSAPIGVAEDEALPALLGRVDLDAHDGVEVAVRARCRRSFFSERRP